MDDRTTRRTLLRSGLYGLAVTGVALPSSGCATLLDLLQDYVKAPTLQIKGMKILEASLSTLTVRFNTLIANPNQFGFRLNVITYALSLAGIELAKGAAKKGIDLRPRAHSTTDLDVSFDLGRSAEAILDMLQRKKVDYAVDTVGRFSALSAAGVKTPSNAAFDIPARFAGSMPLPTIPKIDVASFDVTRLNVDGVGFRIETTVDNDNDFELPIDALKLDVKLNNRTVLNNKTVKSLRVGKNKKSKVPIDFRVDLVDLGLTAAALASNPRLNWEVATELLSGKLKLPFTERGNVRLA